METEYWLSGLQYYVICPALESDQSSPRNSFYPLKIHFKFFHLRLGLPSGPFISTFHTETLCALLLSLTHSTCPGHPIFLNLITRMIFGEYKSELLVSEFYLILKRFINCLYVVILSHVLIRRYGNTHTLNFMNVYFQTTLLASDKLSHGFYSSIILYFHKQCK
jgi:hypothetical protein